MSHRRWPLAVAVAALVVLAGTAVAVLSDRRSSDDGSDADTTSAGAVPADALSGPGTELPDGLTVASGSSLIGPAVVDAVDEAGEPSSWFALLQIDGDPIAVWTDYAGQIADLFPDEGIDPDQAPGCMTAETDGTLCHLTADATGQGRQRRANVRVVSIPGDVTGRHLLVLEMATLTGQDVLGDDAQGGGDPWPGDPLPEPQEPRPRPGVGEPLAPETVAYPDQGDNDRYVVLDGSELLAQYGRGSITGGFDVVLRVARGADVDAVADAYADQANQIAGEPVPAPEVVEHGGTTVQVYRPPGGAGGYSGEVIAVDQSGDAADYVVYELAND